jgi:hypothetical protein
MSFNLKKYDSDPDYHRCKHGMVSDWCHYCLGGERTFVSTSPNTVDGVLKTRAKGLYMPRWGDDDDA